MGAIASVLQWHCGNCSLINPTEHEKCLRCGVVRQTKSDDPGREQSPSSGTIFGSNANCTVIRKPRRLIEHNKECISPTVKLRLVIDSCIH